MLMCSVASDVSDSATLWTAARQAPPSMGFSRRESWSGLPCPPPGDLPNPGIELTSPTLQADSSPAEPLGKPLICIQNLILIEHRPPASAEFNEREEKQRGQNSEEDNSEGKGTQTVGQKSRSTDVQGKEHGQKRGHSCQMLRGRTHVPNSLSQLRGRLPGSTWLQRSYWGGNKTTVG